MNRWSRAIDRRQFGRRRTLWHAWVIVAGRGREPCVVRNFSSFGALLEFVGPVPAAGHLILTIEPFDFEVVCHVRHRSRTGLGVNFDETAPEELPASRIKVSDVVERLRWHAHATRT